MPQKTHVQDSSRTPKVFWAILCHWSHRQTCVDWNFWFSIGVGCTKGDLCGWGRWHLCCFLEKSRGFDVVVKFSSSSVHRQTVKIRGWDMWCRVFWLNKSIKIEFSWLFGYFWVFVEKKNKVLVMTTATMVLKVRKMTSRLGLNEKRQVVLSSTQHVHSWEKHVVHC